MSVIAVSACLLGVCCRYKGDGKASERILELAKRHTLVGICPEQLGGLATPRAPAEQFDGRVITNEGNDVTSAFEAGAKAALRLIKLANAEFAILKARSPSCGSGRVYDGTFSGVLTDGDGVTARLFKENGIKVFSEEELDSLPL